MKNKEKYYWLIENYDTYFDDLSKVLFDYNASNSTSYNLPKEVMDNTKYTELMKSNPLFEYAFKQLDKPYVYSMAGPESFDCSGFVCCCSLCLSIRRKRFIAGLMNKAMFTSPINPRSCTSPSSLTWFHRRQAAPRFLRLSNPKSSLVPRRPMPSDPRVRC